MYALTPEVCAALRMHQEEGVRVELLCYLENKHLILNRVQIMTHPTATLYNKVIT